MLEVEADLWLREEEEEDTAWLLLRTERALWAGLPWPEGLLLPSVDWVENCLDWKRNY